jgi:ribosomal protein L31
MEFFTVTGKLKKFFLRLEIFDVCTTGDTAHIDTIFTFLPHTRQLVDACVAKLECRIDVCRVCHPWCTHRIFVVVKKKKFFLWL